MNSVGKFVILCLTFFEALNFLQIVTLISSLCREKEKQELTSTLELLKKTQDEVEQEKKHKQVSFFTYLEMHDANLPKHLRLEGLPISNYLITKYLQYHPNLTEDLILTRSLLTS